MSLGNVCERVRVCLLLKEIGGQSGSADGDGGVEE